MSLNSTAGRLAEVLVQRLTVAASILVPAEIEALESRQDIGDLLDLLVEAVRADLKPQNVWLLYAAVSGCLPTSEQVIAFTRNLQLLPVYETTMWVLDQTLSTGDVGIAAMRMEILSGQIVVDVDHTARNDLHTGIQQVVRQVLPIMSEEYDVTPVAWTEPAQAMRELRPEEANRVLNWDSGLVGDEGESHDPTLIVPWRSVVVLPEVPFPDACTRLSALARYSGNEVVAIGYDCIPVLSADLVPRHESDRFAAYLTVIKHAYRVAAIGSTALAEFEGFRAALAPQGLAGPSVVEIPLPVDLNKWSFRSERRTPSEVPLIVSVGTFEPRKNQLALLFAAEVLWREGLRFEILMMGGAGWDDTISVAAADLRARGYSVRLSKAASGAELQEAYRRARFTVFTSLHEGFGLPIAESLEHGTPVITTNFGSPLDIARNGGALVVDPRDDLALVSAMRQLLVDDELVERLRKDIDRRRTRSWRDYVADLWSDLIAPAAQSIDSDSG